MCCTCLVLETILPRRLRVMNIDDRPLRRPCEGRVGLELVTDLLYLP